THTHIHMPSSGRMPSGDTCAHTREGNTHVQKHTNTHTHTPTHTHAHTRKRNHPRTLNSRLPPSSSPLLLGLLQEWDASGQLLSYLLLPLHPLPLRYGPRGQPTSPVPHTPEP